MSLDPIPEDVRRFVLLSVPSIPYLEAVMLFRREASRSLDARQLAVALYISERAAAELLASLAEAGVIRSVGQGFVFAPRDDALRQAIERLADAYAEHLIGLTNLIHDATQKSAKRFADAFRLRKDR